jgi:hypothetical protein
VYRKKTKTKYFGDEALTVIFPVGQRVCRYNCPTATAGLKNSKGRFYNTLLSRPSPKKLDMFNVIKLQLGGVVGHRLEGPRMKIPMKKEKKRKSTNKKAGRSVKRRGNGYQDS